MRKINQYKAAIKLALQENGTWMTSSEIVNYAIDRNFCDGYGYEGHCHPIVKELTNMVKLNMVNRKCGNYVYQYGLPGMTDGKTIILNGKTYKKVARNAK